MRNMPAELAGFVSLIYQPPPSPTLLPQRLSSSPLQHKMVLSLSHTLLLYSLVARGSQAT